MPTVISGFKATNDLTSQRLQVDLGSQIALLDINEAPATFVAKRVNTMKAKQPKVSWLTDEHRVSVAQLNWGTNYTSENTALTVDAGEYFAKGDLWQVFDSYEILYVTVAGSTSLDIVEFVRNFPGVASGETGYNVALTDNDWLLYLGNANEEGASAPVAQHLKEVQLDNYCQIVRTPFELTETELASLFEAEPDLPYETRKKGIQHIHEKERLFFWGLPSAAATGAGGKLIRTVGGAWWWIKQHGAAANIVSDTDVTEDEFLEWLRNCFRYGSSTKWLFACPILLSAIEKWGLAKLNTTSGDKTYGFAPTTWNSIHGTVKIVNHKMMEGPNPGTIGGWAFLLDMNEIAYRPLRNTRLLTNRQANDQDRYEAEYLTEFSLTFGNPEKHGVMNNIKTFSA